jgi:P pilus assembly chaperone PapD
MSLLKYFFISMLLGLTACGSSQVAMTMDSLRLISSSDSPQEVMNFANNNCKKDLYQGASFISKSGDEYRFRCIRTNETQSQILIPGTTLDQ